MEVQVVDLMNLPDKIQANLKTVTQQIRRLKESREEVIAEKPNESSINKKFITRTWKTGDGSIQRVPTTGQCILELTADPSDRDAIFLETSEGFWVLSGSEDAIGVGIGRCEFE